MEVGTAQRTVNVTSGPLIGNTMSSEGMQQLIQSAVWQSMQQAQNQGPGRLDTSRGITFPASVRADVNAAQRGQGACFFFV